MSKSIKIDDSVYTKLRELQRPRESYSNVISRLIATVELIRAALPFVDDEVAKLQARVAEHASKAPADR